MDLLARREHGVTELARKLQLKGFDAELIEEVIPVLVQDNLLSDHRFCESMVNSRFNRGHGPTKVRYELRNKGVADSVVEEVMAEISPDWHLALIKLIKKKYAGSLSGTPLERAKKVRFLSSRGFTQEMIYFTMREDNIDQD